MKNIYLFFLFLSSVFSFAQVGINIIDPSATLEVKKSTTYDFNGILIPRLTSAEVQVMTPNLTSAQHSMLIYLTEAVSTPRMASYTNMKNKGYYYYDQPNDVWLSFIDTSSSANPSGLENIVAGLGSFKWRYMGVDSTNYGTAGVYSTDLEYIPADLSATVVGTPYTYAQALTINSDLSAGTNLGATGPYSFVTGTMNLASSVGSSAMGLANSSTGQGSFSTGIASKANGNFSIAMGQGNNTTGNFSVAMGNGCKALADNAVAMGGITTASGANSIAMGISSEASANNTIAMGQGPKATNVGAIAIGSAAEASGENSVAVGPQARAIANYSYALGNQSNASGVSSNSIGYKTNASGLKSTAIGLGTSAESYGTIALGAYNTDETSPEPTSTFDLTKRQFVVGNGNSDDVSVTTKSDVFTILRNGKTGVDIDNFENTTSDTKLQVNGGIQVGNETSSCTSSNEGTIRYVKTLGKFQGCRNNAGNYQWTDLHL